MVEQNLLYTEDDTILLALEFIKNSASQQTTSSVVSSRRFANALLIFAHHRVSACG